MCRKYWRTLKNPIRAHLRHPEAQNSVKETTEWKEGIQSPQPETPTAEDSTPWLAYVSETFPCLMPTCLFWAETGKLIFQFISQTDSRKKKTKLNSPPDWCSRSHNGTILHKYKNLPIERNWQFRNKPIHLEIFFLVMISRKYNKGKNDPFNKCIGYWAITTCKRIKAWPPPYTKYSWLSNNMSFDWWVPLM